MKIIEKLNAKQDIYKGNPVTIAFLGDSVTQGCFECYMDGETVETVFDYKSAYSTRVKEMLGILYPKVQVNIINSGISGDSSKGGLSRIERDVLKFSPDLVVVSFGLNDSCSGMHTLPAYLENIAAIVDKCIASGAEVIFLTQNAMNTKTSCHLKDKTLIAVSGGTAGAQNSGTLKAFMEGAAKVTRERGGTVCDVYPMWEKLIAGGVDTTELLANKINHPIREFHYYMAMKLIETMFS